MQNLTRILTYLFSPTKMTKPQFFSIAQLRIFL